MRREGGGVGGEGGVFQDDKDEEMVVAVGFIFSVYRVDERGVDFFGVFAKE